MDYFRGEYWIEDGSVTFADGDVGDYNHEALAIQRAQGELASLCGFDFDSGLENFQEALGAAAKEEGYIVPKGGGWWQFQVAEFLLSKSGLNLKDHNDLVMVALDQGDAREYAMIHWDWIWCKGTWFGMNKWDEKSKKSLISGINSILDENGFYDGNEVDERGDLSPYDVELTIQTIKGGQDAIYTTLRQLEGEEAGSGVPNTQAGPNAQLAKMDVEGQPGYYGSKMGDSISVKEFVARLLG